MLGQDTELHHLHIAKMKNTLDHGFSSPLRAIASINPMLQTCMACPVPNWIPVEYP
jgi:hypothetical protein